MSPGSQTAATQPQTVRTRSITARFPDFSLRFRLETNPRNPRAQVYGMPCTRSCPCSPPSSGPTPLPALEPPPNAGDGGGLPCYSSISKNGLCLFSFGWSSRIPTQDAGKGHSPATALCGAVPSRQRDSGDFTGRSCVVAHPVALPEMPGAIPHSVICFFSASLS